MISITLSRLTHTSHLKIAVFSLLGIMMEGKDLKSVMKQLLEPHNMWNSLPARKMLASGGAKWIKIFLTLKLRRMVELAPWIQTRRRRLEFAQFLLGYNHWVLCDRLYPQLSPNNRIAIRSYRQIKPCMSTHLQRRSQILITFSSSSWIAEETTFCNNRWSESP